MNRIEPNSPRLSVHFSLMTAQQLKAMINTLDKNIKQIEKTGYNGPLLTQLKEKVKELKSTRPFEAQLAWLKREGNFLEETQKDLARISGVQHYSSSLKRF